MSSLGCTFDETLHTQALAYVLDPSKPHGFGDSALVALVNLVRVTHPRSGAARILNLLRRPMTRTSVKPEYRYRLEGFRDRSVGRSDIWIEAHSRSKSAIVVVENKIRATESDGQLSWYERKAKAWCRARGHSRQLLLFLSRKGMKPKSTDSSSWISLSYLELASVLRHVWRHNRRAPGASWLAMYIASVAYVVYGLDLSQPSGIVPSDLEDYLGRRP